MRLLPAFRSRVAVVPLALALLTAGMPAHPAAAATKEPPACAAISFRSLASGMPDGEREAGMYKSRFGRIEIVGTVQGGRVTNYAMHVAGKEPPALAGTLPKAVEPCLKSKHVAVPVKQAAGGCTGDRLRVVVHRSGSQKLAMLFVLQGSDWALCRAATV